MTRRPHAPIAALTAALTAVCILAAGAAGAAGCASGADRAAVKEQASPAGTRRTPFPAATTSMSEGRSGLRIVSVAPPPYATGPWTGADVIVAYLPMRARWRRRAAGSPSTGAGRTRASPG